MAAIEFHGLTKRYGSVTAVDDLTFTPPRAGTITGFVGANGAGKSTTMRMLLGLTRPTSGTATINGLRYADLRDPLRQIGAMMDPDVFHPPVGTQRAAGARAAGGIPTTGSTRCSTWSASPRAAARRAGGYSMGMRQRLGPGRRAARRPRDPGARRAGQRPRPAGRALAAHPAARPGRRGPHRARVQPPARRAGADRRRRRHHRAGRLVVHEPMSQLLDHRDGASLEDVYLELIQPAFSVPAGSGRESR